jgi:multiple sugar transport system substrate-binding protein
MTRIGRRTLLAGMSAVPLAGAMPRIASAQTLSLNYWHHFAAPAAYKGLERVMALFKQRHPGIALTQETIPNAEYMAKVTAAVVSNARPDTGMITAERAKDLVAMRAMTDITDRVKGWARYGEYDPSAFEGAMADGRIYGIPAFTFVDWMYYRKDWFAEAGLAPPKTLADFQAAAIKLTDPSKRRYGFSLRGAGGGDVFVVNMIESFGSPIVVNGKPAIDRAKAIEAVTFWSELFTKHKVVPPSAPNDSFRQIMEAFKTGQTAMVMHHTGSLAEVSEAMKPEQWGTVPIPAGPAAQVARVAYLSNGVMNPRNIDAAFAWVSFWAEPDPSIAILEETGYFPSSPKVAADPRIVSNPIYTAAVETLKFGRLPPSFVGGAGWSEQVVLPEFQKVLVGRATPAQAVDAMMKGLEAAVN